MEMKTGRQMGSPHFRACHEAGGVPIAGSLFDKWSKTGWRNVSFCFDKRKKDFVNGGYILVTGFDRWRAKRKAGKTVKIKKSK